MDHPKFVGIDLFAGAGGLSYGLSRAGFDMKIGVESDPYCATTLQKNHPNMDVFQTDIRRTIPLDIIKSAGLRKRDIDLVSGGPPCRGFSQSNRRSWRLDNPHNSLYKEFFRYVKAIEPSAFLLENVAGLKNLEEGAVFNDILYRSKRLGYQIQSEILNSEDFSVPQRRRRIIFIGTKNKAESLFRFKKTGEITVREAIDDLPKLKNGNTTNKLEYSTIPNSDYQKKMRIGNKLEVSNNLITRNSDLVLKRYSYIPQGGNWRDIPSKLMLNYKNTQNCHGWIYYRLKWNQPAVVISNFRKNMLIHPSQNRGLSVREAARLQSFPDRYIFYGFLGSQQQQVANAVPPFMAEGIGRNMIKHLTGL